jgi:hypothetical protein
MKIKLTINDPSVEGEDIIVESDSIATSIKELNILIGIDHQATMKTFMASKKENMEVFTGALYGWDRKGKKIVPNWKEQQIILMIKRWATGYPIASFGEISKRLNSMGLKGKKGGKWSRNGVMRTLNNTIHDRIHEFDKPDWWE